MQCRTASKRKQSLKVSELQWWNRTSTFYNGLRTRGRSPTGRSWKITATRGPHHCEEGPQRHRQSKILHTSIQNIGMKKEMPTDPRQRHRQSRVTEENLRQWLHPQSFWPFSHACRPPCRCTGDWKVPDCSGWMPKSFGPQRHDHWNGRLGAVPQGGPSPTAHHGAAPPAPLSCSTRSCHESTDCRVPPGVHPWWVASSPSCPGCVQWSGQVG